jgi:hypothetical protein
LHMKNVPSFFSGCYCLRSSCKHITVHCESQHQRLVLTNVV